MVDFHEGMMRLEMRKKTAVSFTFIILLLRC